MDYAKDISKYVGTVRHPAVTAIVKYCGIALASGDSSTVSGNDAKELLTVRNGFAAKKLRLEAATADAAIQSVLARMRGDRRKSRVTFYYLLADATGTLDRLAPATTPSSTPADEREVISHSSRAQAEQLQ